MESSAANKDDFAECHFAPERAKHFVAGEPLCQSSVEMPSFPLILCVDFNVLLYFYDMGHTLGHLQADVEASVSYRAWKEGKDDEYMRRVLQTVAESKAVAEAEGIVVPTTMEE